MAFIAFDNYPTGDIDNTGKVVFHRPNTCQIDSIWLTNTTDANIFVDIVKFKELMEDGATIQVKTHELIKHLLTPYESKEVKIGSISYSTDSDIYYANSDNSSHFFDTVFNYREWLIDQGSSTT